MSQPSHTFENITQYNPDADPVPTPLPSNFTQSLPFPLGTLPYGSNQAATYAHGIVPAYVQTLNNSQAKDRDVDMASNKSATTSELLKAIQEELHAQREQGEQLGQGIKELKDELTETMRETMTDLKVELKGVITDLKDQMVSFTKVMTESIESTHALLQGITNRLDHIQKDSSQLRKDTVDIQDETRKTQQDVEQFQQQFNKKQKSQTLSVAQASAAAVTETLAKGLSKMSLKSLRSRPQLTGVKEAEGDKDNEGDNEDNDASEE